MVHIFVKNYSWLHFRMKCHASFKVLIGPNCFTWKVFTCHESFFSEMVFVIERKTPSPEFIIGTPSELSMEKLPKKMDVLMALWWKKVLHVPPPV